MTHGSVHDKFNILHRRISAVTTYNYFPSPWGGHGGLISLDLPKKKKWISRWELPRLFYLPVGSAAP